MTSSPGCHITTRWPVARTVPDSSMPGISCASHAGLGYSPIRWSRSARLSAVEWMSTSTSSGPIAGSSTSSSVRTSGPPWECRTTARTPRF